MMRHNLLSEAAAVNMRVYLGGGYLLVTQHTLDSPQVGSSLKKMRGERVTERMWTHRFGNTRLCGKVPYNIEHHTD